MKEVFVIRDAENEVLFKCEVEQEYIDTAREHILKSMDVGQTILRYNALGNDNRSLWFRFRQVREGLRWGYPICCIIDYCFSERPGWKYGWLPSKQGGRYIPCRLCSKKHAEKTNL